MKKNHGRLLSMALSGAMVVSSLSMTVPMTAFAAGEVYAKVGNNITFATGAKMAGTLKADYDESVKLVAGDSSIDGTRKEVGIEAGLPKTSDAIASFNANPSPSMYEGAWVNSEDEQIITDAEIQAAIDAHTTLASNPLLKYSNVLIPVSGTTLTAEWVGLPVKVAIDKAGVEYGTTNTSTGFTASSKNVSYRYDTPLFESFHKEFEDLSHDGWTFMGWDLDGNAKENSIEVVPNADAVTWLAALDKRAIQVGYTNWNNTPAFSAVAVWKEDKYTVTYNGNGFTGGSGPADVSGKTYAQLLTAGASSTEWKVLSHSFEKTGFTAKKDSNNKTVWNTKADGSGVDITEDMTILQVAEAVGDSGWSSTEAGVFTTQLYAQWDEKVEKKEARLAKTQAITANDDVSAYPTITFSDKWADVSAAGSIVAHAKQDVVVGEEFEFPTVNTSLMPGANEMILGTGDTDYTFEFVGWDTEPATKTHPATAVYKYKDGVPTTTATITADTMFYPVFTVEAKPQEVISGTLTIDNNASKVNAAGVLTDNYKSEIFEYKDVASGTKIKAEENLAAPQNYHLVGWSTTAQNLGTKLLPATAEYPIGKEYEATFTSQVDNVTLYDVWQADTFKIEFYGDQTSTTPKAIETEDWNSTKKLDTLYTATASITDFRGWATTKDAANPDYPIAKLATTEVKDLFELSSNGVLSLYAVATPGTELVNITYTSDLKRAGAPDDVVSMKKGSTFKLDGTLTYTTQTSGVNDAEIYGWTLDKDYGTKANAEAKKAEILLFGSEYTIGNDPKTFYAVWRDNPKKYTFDENTTDTDGDPLSGTVIGTIDDLKVYDEETIDLPSNTYTIFGYTFDGWTNGGKKYTDGQKGVKVAGLGTTFTAQWKANNYRVVYDKNSEYASGTRNSDVISKDGLADPIGAVGFSSDAKYVTFAGYSLSAETDPNAQAYPDPTKTGLFTRATTYSAILEAAKAEPGKDVTVYAIWKPTEFAEVQAEAEAAKEEAEIAKKAAEQADQKAADAAKDAAAAKADAAAQKDAATKANDAKTAAEAAKAVSDKAAADAKTAQTTAEQKAADAQKTADSANAKLKLATALTTNAGKTKKVSGTSYKTDADAGKSVAVTKGKNVKTLTIGKTVKIGGNTYKVRALNAKAFTGKKIRTIKIAGNNLKNVDVNAFKNTKATKITITKCKAVKKQLQAAAKAAGLKCTVKGTTATITKK